MRDDFPRAILFDVFGTVVDWRGSLIEELSAFGAARGIAGDWTTLVDRWRGNYVPSMDRVRRGELPWTRLDDLHRASLDELVTELGIAGLTEDDRAHLTRAWHRLRPWPDVVAGLTRLKRRYIIGTLSNGNFSLLANLAKHAGLPWDVVIGGDLLRHYKPDKEVYRAADAYPGTACSPRPRSISAARFIAARPTAPATRWRSRASPPAPT